MFFIVHNTSSMEWSQSLIIYSIDINTNFVDILKEKSDFFQASIFTDNM
eukprot:03015.XXX_116766_116912_1 [CDS] Oithona nana genome sequencing.